MRLLVLKLQAHLDGQAVLSAMAYVDLNPIRATMATTPEESEHTSIQLRIAYWKDKANGKLAAGPDENSQPTSLMSFVDNPRQPTPPGLAFNLVHYLELVDWTGRVIRDDKRGSIQADKPPIIQRLGISAEHYSF